MFSRKSLWPLALLLVTLLALAGCSAAGGSSSAAEAAPTPTHTFAGTVTEGAPPVPDFVMQSADGPVQLSDFRGKYVYVYFGYTFCPDICPTTLADLAGVREALGDDADKVQVMMITVDPGRDTPEVLKEYVTFFDPTFVGVTGSPQAINEVGKLFDVQATKREGTTATNYLVDHTALTYLIDPQGRARVAYPFGVKRSEFVEDLRWLFAQEG